LIAAEAERFVMLFTAEHEEPRGLRRVLLISAAQDVIEETPAFDAKGF
jgi:hypothetical protein